ncbi:MAG: histidine phosphatase family protein [Lautropia sp.]|nr:histidine phosphatase family protein [Lautropia sp.]
MAGVRSLRPLSSRGDVQGAVGRGSRAAVEALPATLAPDELRLVLIRHGETAWNQAGRIQGQLDLPLNEVGLLQAQAAAACFRPGMIDVLYSSDLQRARQTAAPIAEATGLVPRLDACWRERHFGAFQGQVYGEIAQHHPEVFARLKARDTEQDLGGGECLGQLLARVQGALDEMLARHRGQRVALVSHGGVLDCIYRLAMGLPLNAPRDFPIFNAGINHLRWLDGRWQLLHWGDIAHLVDSRDELDPRARPSSVAGKVG